MLVNHQEYECLPLDSRTSADNRIVKGYLDGMTGRRAFSAKAPSSKHIRSESFNNLDRTLKS